MKRSSRIAAIGVAAVAVLALAASAVVAAGPGETVKVKSQITIGATGYQGKVKADNSNCVGERIVVLKQKGNGVLSRVERRPTAAGRPTSKNSTRT